MIKKFLRNGGQNPIEAAKLGCKIYHGPHIYNFEEIYNILNEYGISKKIENHTELCDRLIVDLENPKKENNKISNSIKNLELKTLNSTMRIVENFIK